MTGLARMTHDVATQLVDVATDAHGFIALDGGLQTPAFVSLFTDRRARPSDKAPVQRGWWGDAHARTAGDQIGSLLWILERVPFTAENMRRAQLFASECLAWMVRDGLAKSVKVVVEAKSEEVAWVRVTIVRPDGTEWSQIWDQHGNEVGSAIP